MELKSKHVTVGMKIKTTFYNRMLFKAKRCNKFRNLANFYYFEIKTFNLEIGQMSQTYNFVLHCIFNTCIVLLTFTIICIYHKVTGNRASKAIATQIILMSNTVNTKLLS